MVETEAKIERLPFELPGFLRIAWVSSKAEDAWSLKLSAVSSLIVRLSRMERRMPPECCVYAADSARRAGFRDPIWTQYPLAEKELVEVEAPWQTNDLLRAIGLYPDFAPCHPECKAAVEYIDEFVSRAGDIGAEAQAEWWKEILSWPMSWDARNGIAQVFTPVLKISYPTTAVKGIRIIHRLGTRFPDEGMRGLRFPFLEPKIRREAAK